MKFLIGLIFAASAFAQSSVYSTPASASWSKYTVTKIANAVSGCANANGCWQVNGGTPVNATAGLTQSITLFQLPANGFVHDARVKTSTACAGATTIVITLGTTGSGTWLVVTPYDLKAAVSATNYTASPLTHVGSDTSIATNILAAMTTTVSNVDQITAGCTFNVSTLVSVLP